MIKKLTFLVLKLGIISSIVGWSSLAYSQNLRPAAKLSAEDQKNILKIERFFNSIRTLKGRFVQVSPKGTHLYGTLYLMRPGKMRFEYDNSPISLIADGTWLIQYDAELEQANRTFLSDTPADFLVRDNFNFSGDIRILSFERGPGVLRITVVDMDEPDAYITLVFTENPMRLKQWIMIQPGGEQTTVSLNSYETGIQIDRDLFNFVNPEWEKAKRRNRQ